MTRDFDATKDLDNFDVDKALRTLGPAAEYRARRQIFVVLQHLNAKAPLIVDRLTFAEVGDLLTKALGVA